MINIFDGGMGTMLQAKGLRPGASPELMNLEAPEVVAGVHLAYIEAGATVITTNSFGATPLKLKHYQLSERMAELNEAAVQCARNAIKSSGKSNIRIAGDIGPLGQFIVPLGELDFEEAYGNFFAQAKALVAAKVDFLIIETMIDMSEMRAALLAAKAAVSAAGENIPIICQFTYAEDHRTVTGTDPYTAAVTLDALGADIIGANCSLGPAEMLPVVRQIAKATDKPIIIQPNAGMPRLVDGKTIFPMEAANFAAYAPALVEAGASYLGGCCGTTPEHIKAIAAATSGLSPLNRPARKPVLELTSRTKTVSIGHGSAPLIIGERINPTGRKALAAAIKTGSFAAVKKEALGQTKAGASVLDVNMGVAGIDQAAAMCRAVNELSQLVDTPLAIDTSDAAALEAALRLYPGRALINSVSAEKQRLEEFLPLAKKYGAAVICLPLERDLPKTAAERAALVRRIVAAAKAVGLSDRDFLLDALVLTVASEKSAADEVLKTIRLYKEEFGYPATIGLSNISFGLPNRPLINRTFYAMCLAAGLDAPIMNPYDEAMQETFAAAKALLGIDPNGLDYSRQEAAREKPDASPSVVPPRDRSGETLPPAPKNKVNAEKSRSVDEAIAELKRAILEGNKDEIGELVKKAIDRGFSADEITNDGLTAAMNELGDDFGAGRVFLPQVLLAAETMRAAFERLKEIIPQAAKADQGTFIIATVKGDVHDLGKNIVAALLENSGFRVIDLGKDVEKETIVQAALENQADIVGLCALMTTTMPELDKVIAALKKAGAKAKVMIGGAAVTLEYMAECGADSYAPDGVAAVKLAKQLREK